MEVFKGRTHLSGTQHVSPKRAEPNPPHPTEHLLYSVNFLSWYQPSNKNIIGVCKSIISVPMTIIFDTIKVDRRNSRDRTYLCLYTFAREKVKIVIWNELKNCRLENCRFVGKLSFGKLSFRWKIVVWKIVVLVNCRLELKNCRVGKLSFWKIVGWQNGVCKIVGLVNCCFVKLSVDKMSFVKDSVYKLSRWQIDVW